MSSFVCVCVCMCLFAGLCVNQCDFVQVCSIFDGLCWILFNSEFGVQTDSAHPDLLNVVFLDRAFDLSTQKTYDG